MSYEGFTEYLCVNGHGHEVDASILTYGEGAPPCCPACGGAWEFMHDVDETNGYDEDNPDTCRADVETIGHEDVWHEDHYGNKYATKRHRFAPAEGSAWERVSAIEARQKAEQDSWDARRRYCVQAKRAETTDWDFLYTEARNGGPRQLNVWTEMQWDLLILVKTEVEATKLRQEAERAFPDFDFRVNSHILSEEEMDNATQDG